MSTTQVKRWLVLGDVHEYVKNLDRLAKEEAAALIVTGDLTNCGGVFEAKQVVSVLRSLSVPFYAQLGNMDREEITPYLTDLGCNLHRSVQEISDGVLLFGLGGSIPTPFHTPSEYSEADLALWLEELWAKVRFASKTILVSHNPPYGSQCDRIKSGAHVGSHAVANFIRERQPDVCLCGHIHESWASERIGKTLVINPGAWRDGRFAVLSLDAEGQFFVNLRSV